jgi:hypothetical protein
MRGGAGFATETFERLGIFGEIVREEFEGNEAAEFGVLGLLDYPHPATAQLLNDEVVGDRPSYERIVRGHSAAILGCAKRQVTNRERIGNARTVS